MSLHVQYFFQYFCSSQQGTLFITPTLHVMLSFPIHLSNSAETLSRAPMTRGTVSKFLNFHNLLISFFQILVLFHFFFSFSSTLTSAGTISIIIPFCSFFLITIRSGRLASIRLLHWIFMSDSTLISLFSTAPSRACSYNFSTVLTCSIYKYPNKLSLQHCCAIFCILYEPIFHICLLCVAHFHLFPTKSTQGALTCLIGVVLHIICPDCLLLSGTQQCFCSNLLITIATFFPYQLSPLFP